MWVIAFLHDSDMVALWFSREERARGGKNCGSGKRYKLTKMREEERSPALDVVEDCEDELGLCRRVVLERGARGRGEDGRDLG